jgi:hypothetical protein
MKCINFGDNFLLQNCIFFLFLSHLAQLIRNNKFDLFFFVAFFTNLHLFFNSSSVCFYFHLITCLSLHSSISTSFIQVYFLFTNSSFMPLPFYLCSSKFLLRSHVPGCGSVSKKCNKNRQKSMFYRS